MRNVGNARSFIINSVFVMGLLAFLECSDGEMMWVMVEGDKYGFDTDGGGRQFVEYFAHPSG